MGSNRSETETSESSSAKLGELPWYVAYTQPKREQLAAFNLAQQGFQAYLPQYKTFKKSPAVSLSTFEPMFPRYLFFRPDNVGQSISGARSTRGVSFILSFGFSPAVLKPEQLLAIQAYEAERNRADMAQISPFQPGLQVRLRHCGLRGLEGLVQSVSSKRVAVLLNLLGRQKVVTISHHQLELT
jgi:transcriptional antiterminator RfaH